MFKLKEALHIIIAAILFAFVISFLSGLDAFLISLLVAFIILAVNILAKKITAHYLETEIEHKIWHFQRYGFYDRSYFRKPIPAGILLPFIAVWLSYPYGFLKVLTFLQFDPKASSARVAKRHGLYRYSELTEFHIAAIAASGIFATLILAVISYFFGGYADWILTLTSFSVYYSLWNLIPISQLDGCKLFFGSLRLWIFLVFLSLIALGFILLVA